MMSVFAISVDVIVPALHNIGNELTPPGNNSTQYIISVLVFGMAFGQLLYGPLSDTIGRKAAIYAGLIIFILGSLVCIFANNFWIILLGRLMQGFGAAGPRIVTIAIIRDRFSGSAMAKIMSIIITVFIIGPMVAPFIGQGILLIASWESIFVFLAGLGGVILVWFFIRHPETLPVENRRPFSITSIYNGIGQTLASRVAIGHTIASGLSFAALFGYINSAPQIFIDMYSVGTNFPFYFSGLALAVGLATILNSWLVSRINMHRLCRLATLTQLLVSLCYFLILIIIRDQPSLESLMIYLAAMFFCLGILFGNLNSIAMEPLGHIAGVAASIIGAISLFIAIILGTIIGQCFNDTLFPLVAGFTCLSLLTLATLYWSVLDRKDILSN